jgi:hypothetical protein
VRKQHEKERIEELALTRATRGQKGEERVCVCVCGRVFGSDRTRREVCPLVSWPGTDFSHRLGRALPAGLGSRLSPPISSSRHTYRPDDGGSTDL